MRKVKFGTSGWRYDDWNEIFYPKDLADEEKLKFFAKKFNTVEINNTFYNLPKKNVFANWKDRVPDNFVFAVKASRYITHMKKLTDPKSIIKDFFENVSGLGKKIGPILFQLPPFWKENFERLKKFLQVLPKQHKYVFEFRDKSWYKDEIFKLLKDKNIALCVHDHQDGPSPKILTADFSYFRFHGPGGSYRGKYSKTRLKKFAEIIKKWKNQGINIFCYFNNDFKGNAIENAGQLKKMIYEN
jgi:uncharacterized protein YecE (DUF72 family)